MPSGIAGSALGSDSLGGCGALGAAGSGAGVAAGAGAGSEDTASASPSPSSMAITVPTATFSVPSAIRILPSVPSSIASNSIVALSVSISAMMSPGSIVSPSALSHLASVPSSIVGESAGILSSIAINTLPPEHRCRVRQAPALARFRQSQPMQQP